MQTAERAVENGIRITPLTASIGASVHGIDLAADSVGHCTCVAAKRRAIFDGVVFDARPDKASHEWQMQHGRQEHSGIAIVATAQPPHESRGFGPIVPGPTIFRIGLIDVPTARMRSDLARQRDGPTADTLQDFQQEQIVAPPGGLACMTMRASPGNGDQTATAVEEQVAVADPMACLVVGDPS